MVAFPNFRKIFQDFRTPEDEKNISNAAVFKFITFVAIIVGMSVVRKASFPNSSL
jgi:hypothetical protein